MIETPDVAQITKPNVLFLTSGYAIYDNEELHRNIIERMHQVNAAGLGIQFGRYYKLVPAVIVCLANELQMLIIELAL